MLKKHNADFLMYKHIDKLQCHKVGGVENIEKIFHFVLAALARIQEKQGERQKSIYLHAHDRRTKQHHHYDTDTQ